MTTRKRTKEDRRFQLRAPVAGNKLVGALLVYICLMMMNFCNLSTLTSTLLPSNVTLLFPTPSISSELIMQHLQSACSCFTCDLSLIKFLLEGAFIFAYMCIRRFVIEVRNINKHVTYKFFSRKSVFSWYQLSYQ